MFMHKKLDIWMKKKKFCLKEVFFPDIYHWHKMKHILIFLLQMFHTKNQATLFCF